MYITPFTTSRMMTRRLPPPRLPGGMSGSTSVHSRRSDRLDNAARRDCSGGDFRSSTCGTSKTNRCHTRNHKRFPPFKSSLQLTDSRDSQTSRTDTKAFGEVFVDEERRIIQTDRRSRIVVLDVLDDTVGNRKLAARQVLACHIKHAAGACREVWRVTATGIYAV